MLWVALATVALLVVGDAQVSEGKPTYAVFGMKKFRRGYPYDVAVNILDSPSAVTVVASVKKTSRDSSDQTVVEDTITVSPQNSDLIKLTIPTDLVLLPYGDNSVSYELVVTGQGGIKFTHTQYLTLEEKSNSIFIITDKATYKPLDEIKFRIFKTNADLEINANPPDVAIFDNGGTQRELIKGVNYDTDDSGLTEGIFQLTEQPPEGEWKIVVNFQGQKQEKAVYVEEYVLPKFEVKVGLPPFILPNPPKEMAITVDVKYTFGKPVEGSVKVYCFYEKCLDDGSFEQKPGCISSKTKTLALIEGKATTSVNTEVFESLVAAHLHQECQSCSNVHMEGKKITCLAEATEEGTDIMLSGHSSVKTSLKPLQVEIIDPTPKSYKAGFNVLVIVKVSQPDGSPPPSSNIKLRLDADMQCPYDYDDWYRVKPDSGSDSEAVLPSCTPTQFHSSEYDVPASGIFTLNLLNTPDGFDAINLKANVTDGLKWSQTSRSIDRFRTKNKVDIMLTMDSDDLEIKEGSNIKYSIHCSEAFTRATVMLVSKGALVKGMEVSGASSTKLSFTISFDADLARSLSPSAKMVVYRIIDDELVADSASFTVSASFGNELTLAFSDPEVVPGASVDITGQTQPGSTVAMLAVDTSVLLYRAGNDLSRAMVLDEQGAYDKENTYYPYLNDIWLEKRRRKRSAWAMCWPIYFGGQNTYETFSELDMFALTDATVYSLGGGGPIVYFAEATNERWPMLRKDGQQNVQSTTDDFEGENLAEAKNVRQDFPETWIWRKLNAGDDGSFLYQTNAPDTITSFTLSGVALHSQAGLAVADPIELNVFKELFVQFELPYSLKRKEKGLLQFRCANYLQTSQEMVFTLKKSADFLVVTPETDEQEETKQSITYTKTIKVASNSIEVIRVWVEPLILGHILIEAQVQTPKAADAVQKTLLVEPEGTEQDHSFSVFLPLDGTGPKTETFRIELPADMVPGSEYVRSTVTGNVLGSTMENIDKLLKMPYGCGEQNMLNFAPNVYVMKYLTDTNQLDDDRYQGVKAKAITYMKSGYERELTYLRKDNLYSAFGDSDTEGSTWLTAFVLKVYGQAKEFIVIDTDIVAKSMEALTATQLPSGEFEEKGRVIHSELKGGSGTGVALTAFTVHSLCENRAAYPKVESNIASGLSFLKSKIASETSAYTLSIVAYALSKCSSVAEASEALDKLDSMKTAGEGIRFWCESDCPNGRMKGKDVETNAYALLSYIEKNDIPVSLQILKRLVKEQNSDGGFKSTQDTVLGIESLAQFGVMTTGDSGEQNAVAKVTWGESTSHTFNTVTNDNNAILQVFEINRESTSNSFDVTFEVSGSGTIIPQLTVRYNILKDEPVRMYSVDVESNVIGEVVNMDVCVKYNGDGETNMAMLEAQPLSGHKFIKLNELLTNKIVKRVEEIGQNVNIYVDEFTSTQTCIPLSQTKEQTVIDLKESFVRAYSYYQQDDMQVNTYLPEALKSQSACSACVDCPGCPSPPAGGTQMKCVSIATTVLSLVVCILTILI